MDSRRYIVFLVLSMAILVGWMQFFAPKPPAKNPAAPQQAGAEVEPGDEEIDGGAAIGAGDSGKGDAVATDDSESKAPGDDPATADPDDKPGDDSPAEQVEAELPQNRPQVVELGSNDPESGYFLLARLDSAGASISGIFLNDPRYSELTDRTRQLKVVGNTDTTLTTFATEVSGIDGQLAQWDTSLSKIDWKLAGTEPDPVVPDVLHSATFEFTSPDGELTVRKTYRVNRGITDGDGRNQKMRDTRAAGYLVDLELTIVNHGKKPAETTYVLQGPVGVPLENVEHTRRFRGLPLGFMSEDEAGVPLGERSLDTANHTAAEVVEFEEDDAVPVWKRAIRYIGVDTQYFAALVVPGSDQLKDDWLAETGPVVVGRADKEAHSDISVRLVSEPLEVPAGGQVSHQYQLYAGPKREVLLSEFGAEEAIDLGWAGPISRGMLWLLQNLHDIGFPYGVAIICLTILVRGALYPLSRKQAAGARKMKELQPKIAELKKKYGDDKEKMARAQMELFSKHNYNPLAGCLPLFLQLPIFIGLYNALNNSVDLRMAPFLWFDNLAAPDALIRDIGFSLPYLGSSLNLLPMITVVLFVVQQKMFMPAPDPSDEQAVLQAKMMNFMMIFMGFMFYHVPAGLCVYFIASSLWGMGERKLLDYGAVPAAGGAGGGDGGDDGGDSSSGGPRRGGPAASREKRKGSINGADEEQREPAGLLARLLAQADAAVDPSNAQKRGQSREEPRRQKRSRPRR